MVRNASVSPRDKAVLGICIKLKKRLKSDGWIEAVQYDGSAEVEAFALLQLLGYLLAEPVLRKAFHEGPRVVAAKGADDEVVDRHAQVDGGAIGEDEIHVSAMAGGATAGCDDTIVEFDGGMEQLGFELAECLFTEGSEESGDSVVVTLLEGAVEVEEIHMPLGRQTASEGGLARIHVANKEILHFS